MSATGSETVQVPPSGEQVEALLRDCAALTRALERARKVRLALFLVTAVLVAVAVGMFYNLGRQLRSQENLDRLRGIAEARLASNSGRYMAEVQLLVDHASPVLTDAFYKQSKKDLPSYLHAAGRQRDAFAEEMQARLAQRLDDRYRRALERHGKLWQEEFPLVKDEELHRKMTGNMHVAVERLVKKYYVDEMRGQTVALYDAWDHFPQADPAERGGPSLEDQFIAQLLEMLTLKLTETQGLAQP
jgi:hypothetical protein